MDPALAGLAGILHTTTKRITPTEVRHSRD
jgi:hypothetical protein